MKPFGVISGCPNQNQAVWFVSRNLQTETTNSVSVSVQTEFESVWNQTSPTLVTRLTEAPTTVERVHELIAKNDGKYPNHPASDVCDGTQDPVTTRTRHTGGVGIRELCHSVKGRTDGQSRSRMNNEHNKKGSRGDSLDQDEHSIEIEI